MRVNVYAEEMTDRIEIVEKETGGEKFTGLRLHLAFPGADGKPYDDGSAVTFWGNQKDLMRIDLREGMRAILAVLDAHYAGVRTEESKR